MQIAGYGKRLESQEYEYVIVNFNTFSVFLNIISVIIVFSLAIFIWNKRPAPGTVPFTLFLLVVIIWIFVRSIMVSTDNILTKISLGNLMYLVTTATSISWLCFALDYTGSRWWRRPRNILLLMFVPVVTTLLLASDSQGIREWLRLYPDVEASTAIVVWKKGIFTWVQTAYISSLLLAGTIALCRSAISGKPDQRWKIIFILISSLIPITSHAISTAGLYPVKGLDLTPVALALAGGIYATTIFRFRFLDIIPVARNTLVEKIPDGILVLDAEGCIADMNPAAESLTGISLVSVQGKKLGTVCPWLYDSISGVENGRHIEIIPTTSSSQLFFEASVTTLRNSSLVVTGWLVVIEDITYRRKTDEALKESEEKHRSLVNHIKLGVFRVTHQGKHLEVNSAMENITGYSRQELLNMDVQDLYLNSEDRHLILSRSVSTSEKVTSEVWNRKKDGTQIMVAVTITPVRDSGGNLLFYDGILEDITERKKMMEQIRDLYEKEKVQRQELEAEAKARGLFINTLGHELRTPLTPIVVSAESLKELFNRDPESLESKLINNVYNGSRILVQRLNELLELGKFSQGNITLKLESSELKPLIEKAVLRLQPEVKARGQQLVVELGGNYPVLKIDPVLMEQVLVNLLSYAAKLSPEGGKVILRARVKEGGVLVEVQDEGNGISAEEQERLFQPYHRVEQDRARFPGLGLGLAISRQIIDAHKGRIWLTGLPDRGSIFSFFLPAVSGAGQG
jgi:PAS domain S-box-containing protein